MMFADEHLTLRLIRLVGEKKWEPHERGFCFVFVRGGTGKFAVGSVSQKLGQGDVLVLDGKESGQIGSINNGELVLFSISVLIEHMFPLFSSNEISLLQNLMGSFAPMKFHVAGSPLAVECHRLIGIAPPPFNLDHRAHLLRVVAVILGEEFKLLQRGRPGFVTMEEHLIQVFEKLSSNDLLTLPTEELSAKFGCSRRHLSRLFHRQFGFSVAALRMELRMLRAISLLRDANSKVSFVAEQCGFNHLGLFNTCFKRRFGTSPGRWRTLNIKSPARSGPQTGDQSDCLKELNGGRKIGAPTRSEPPASQMKNGSLSRITQVANGLEKILATTMPSPPASSVDLVRNSNMNTFQ
jgi:AraC-like DNA-binding protein